MVLQPQRWRSHLPQGSGRLGRNTAPLVPCLAVDAVTDESISQHMEGIHVST